MLAKLSEVLRKWCSVLKQVEYALNNTIYKSIETTRSMSFFGVNQSGHLNNKLQLVLDASFEENWNLSEIRKRVSDSTIEN